MVDVADSPEAPLVDHYMMTLCIRAFFAASERFLSERGDEASAFAAAGESLYWASVCDDGYEEILMKPYKEARRKDCQGRYLRGIVWARNRMTHQRAVVFDQHFVTELGPWILGNGGLDSASHFRWADASGIRTDPKHDHGRDEYVRLMQGKPVDQAIEAASFWFAGAPLNDLSRRLGLDLVVNLPGLSE